MDEKNFFDWLGSIPAVKSIRGTPVGLELSVDKPMDRTSLYDLIAVLTRYGLDRKCLKGIAAPEDAKWFEDPAKYWHSAIFS
jgi:hypothetical protein